MSKQTVEEIAYMLLTRAREDHYGDLNAEDGDGFVIGVEYGINWQKEQGIDWISVEEKGLPEVGEDVLILLEAETFLKGKVKYNAKGEKIWVAYFLDGENVCRGRTVTHYTYVNLPKTIQP